MGYEQLTDNQKELYNLLHEGNNIEKISKITGKPFNILNAQLTRMKNKGVTVPDPYKGMREHDNDNGHSNDNNSNTLLYDFETIGAIIHVIKSCGGKDQAHEAIDQVHQIINDIINPERDYDTDANSIEDWQKLDESIFSRYYLYGPG